MAEKTAEPYFVIKPPSGLFSINLRELWNYRELAYFFAWREIKVRYKQTTMGVLWAIFQPLAATLIFTVFFGRLAKVPSDGIPYPIFVYTGLLFWNYFAFCVSHASESMIANSNIIQKIYFPRLLIPVASSLVGIVDFFISAMLFFCMMIYYKCVPGPLFLLAFIPLLALTFLSSVGIGSFLGALNVKYRDVRYIVPFFMQMLLFLTPVIYPASMIGGQYNWLLALNPMAGVIEAARYFIFGTHALNINLLCWSAIGSLFYFAAGIIYFRKTEYFFADMI